MRNNNTNERNEMSNYSTTTLLYEIVASKMEKGLTAQSDQIAAMRIALADMGKSYIQINYHLSVDEDFIPDVLQSYKGVKKRKPISPVHNLNPWINHPKKT